MVKNKIELTPEMIIPSFRPLIFQQERFLLLKGSAGSGKSVFAAQKMLIRTLTEPGHRILFIRKVARTIRDSQFALLKSLINDWKMSEYFKIKETEMDLTCLYNGSMLLSTGVDDREKLKSIHGITSIWIEEATELEEEDLNQINLRLRGMTPHYKQIILSFNPIDEDHWLRKRFFPN